MESDLSLIEKIQKTKDEDCLVELIQRHSGIYIYIVDQFAKKDNPFIDKSLLLEDKNSTIYEAALTFKPEANTKFSTYLANKTKWNCFDQMNKARKRNELSIDEVQVPLTMEENPLTELTKLEAHSIFERMLNEEKDERVKKIIDIRYNTTNTKLVPWRVPAEKLGMSIQGCINIHDRFINKVKTEINKQRNYA